MKEAVDADQDTENKSCLITGAVFSVLLNIKLGPINNLTWLDNAVRLCGFYNLLSIFQWW